MPYRKCRRLNSTTASSGTWALFGINSSYSTIATVLEALTLKAPTIDNTLNYVFIIFCSFNIPVVLSSNDVY